MHALEGLEENHAPYPETNGPTKTQPTSVPAVVPCTLFFYGTLSLPQVLQNVLSLPSLPPLNPARTRGFVMKMWGPYPAIVLSTDESSLVYGAEFTVATVKHLQRLQNYEGENYKLVDCTIETSGVEKAGRTFMWTGYPEELRDGTFDRGLFMTAELDGMQFDHM
jgi:gamma-glutamylcyclotransferase (GGCT)/AIG2-like uncharacterized protein YtfP